VKIVKLSPRLAAYYVKFYDMAEEWCWQFNKKPPQLVIRLVSDYNAKGEVSHRPPTIRLWLGRDETYAKYLFLHELAHIAKGRASNEDNSHNDAYLRTLRDVVDFFEFDRDYVIRQEAEYRIVRMAFGVK
jgi:hypothetical protein